MLCCDALGSPGQCRECWEAKKPTTKRPCMCSPNVHVPRWRMDATRATECWRGVCTGFLCTREKIDPITIRSTLETASLLPRECSLKASGSPNRLAVFFKGDLSNRITHVFKYGAHAYRFESTIQIFIPTVYDAPAERACIVAICIFPPQIVETDPSWCTVSTVKLKRGAPWDASGGDSSGH